MLARSTWGAVAQTLRIASFALVFSSTEYCSPVWLHNVHASQEDYQLNGTINETTLKAWLPLLIFVEKKHLLNFWQLEQNLATLISFRLCANRGSNFLAFKISSVIFGKSHGSS